MLIALVARASRRMIRFQLTIAKEIADSIVQMTQFDLGGIGDIELFRQSLLLRIEFTNQIDFRMEVVNVHDVADLFAINLEQMFRFVHVEMSERDARAADRSECAH